MENSGKRLEQQQIVTKGASLNKEFLLLLLLELLGDVPFQPYAALGTKNLREIAGNIGLKGTIVALKQGIEIYRKICVNVVHLEHLLIMRALIMYCFLKRTSNLNYPDLLYPSPIFMIIY